MKAPNKIVMSSVIGLALLALGAVGGWWAGHETTATHEQQNTAPQQQKKILYWYDPMQPEQHFDKPGNSPMGMEMIPKYADDASDNSGVKIDSALTQNLGMRLATVTRISLATRIETTGIIGFNERDIAVVQSRTNGFVERVWPLAPGDVVRAGQPLVELLVPEWSAAQYEFQALRATNETALMSAARERMRLLGMPEELIQNIERNGDTDSRFTLRAPISGVVQSLDVRSGMTLQAGQTLARINGLATVWLDAAVPEALAGNVRMGTAAVVRLTSSPEKTIAGVVTAILPALNDATRTLRVRIELPNRNGLLRPGLSAQITLTSGSKSTALAVPTEAIIRTGKRTLVMVAKEQGRFMPVAVTLGNEMDNQTVITTGLSEGEQVIASGQFLIDSEASLIGIETSAGDK